MILIASSHVYFALLFTALPASVLRIMFFVIFLSKCYRVSYTDMGPVLRRNVKIYLNRVSSFADSLLIIFLR